jgi:hypothetical protein
MKKIQYLIAIVLVVIACNKQEIVLNVHKTLPIKVSLGGEFSNNETPLSKSGETKYLYGIQVINSSTNEPFAIGLFDNIDDVNVNLLAGYVYKFKVTLIKNGKDVISPASGGIYNQQVFAGLQLTNSFNYTSLNNYGATLDSSGGRDGYSNRITYQYDRYYGEVANYSPEVNGSIIIPLKHVVYGLRYSISGLTDGSLALTVVNPAPQLSDTDTYTLFNVSNITSDVESDEHVFQCRDIVSAYQNPTTYKETLTLSLVWTRENSISQNLGSVSIDVLRNRLNIININLTATDVDTPFGITLADSEMGDESIVINL